MKNRILIVEDESIVALDLQNRLESNGFDVIDIVSNGSRAVEKAITEIPDLILMDINLKGSIDGIEAASLIKRQIDCAIVFLTAFADEKTLKKARVSDASGYILKPFRENELLITIELAIKRASVKKKIEENSNWLYSTLNNIQDAVITVSNENQIIFLNESARTLIGENVSEGDVFDHELFIHVEGGRTYFQYNDKKTDIDYFQTDIFDEDKTLLGKVHFIHDISKQVAFEIGLEKARIAAENSNRAKSDFLANVTHELRTPLNTIIGMNSLISELYIDEEVSKMHELIGQAAETLLRQVNELLEFSDIDRGQLKINISRFSIQELISEILGTFKDQIELKSLKIVDNSDDIPLLVGDKNKVRDIISCLFSNAVKFTKSGQIRIRSQVKENTLILSIADTGIGFSEEQKDSIFNLLMQVDGSHTRIFGGIGVGLSLVKELLDLLNGSIEVESVESEGSQFTIRIPIDISDDQKSEVEDNRKFEPSLSSTENPLSEYSDLVILLKEIDKLLIDDDYKLIEKKIKGYSKSHKLIELNFESNVLFRVSIAMKLKNKEKFKTIMKEVIVDSEKTTGGRL
ncbi:MAG: response regulator [Spirochaetaceae bacterium]|nr:response regulator [Spirochaetaceae bacterium]